MKIGVFDSGIGGKSVASAIQKDLPSSEIVFVTDSEHFPYATKTSDEIWAAIEPIFNDLVAQNCDAIVVACNTVSTTLMDKLREAFPATQFVAIVPMIKSAATQTKSGKIVVCATPTTLGSNRYNQLKQEFAQNLEVLEPNCADWSQLIEENSMNEQSLRQEIEPALQAGADVIVLACTHYHWIEQEIKELAADKAVVLQPEQAIVRQLRRVLGLDSRPVS